MTEQEEDEELMLNASQIDNDDELITRFDASPWCKYLMEINNDDEDEEEETRNLTILC